MTRPNWRSVVELVGIGAIVASLVFVGLELRQAHKIAVAQLFQENIHVRVAVNELKTQNADLIAKSNRGDELTNGDNIALRALIDSVWSQAFFGTASWRTLSVNENFGSGPSIILYRFLRENPGPRRVWVQYREGMEHDWELFLGDTLAVQLKSFNDNIENMLTHVDEVSE
jgi:hypothetical protein